VARAPWGASPSESPTPNRGWLGWSQGSAPGPPSTGPRLIKHTELGVDRIGRPDLGPRTQAGSEARAKHRCPGSESEASLAVSGRLPGAASHIEAALSRDNHTELQAGSSLRLASACIGQEYSKCGGDNVRSRAFRPRVIILRVRLLPEAPCSPRTDGANASSSPPAARTSAQVPRTPRRSPR